MSARATVRRVGVAAVALLVASSGAELAAQSGPVCSATGVPASFAADGCRKVSDLFRFLAPQIGTAITGGNAVIGEGGTVGGFGHVSAALTLRAVDGRVPDNTVPVTFSETPVSSDFGAQRAPVPIPSLDGSIGIFRGIPFGLTNILGIDALVGMTFVPEVTDEDVEIRPDNGGVAYMVGARVGIVQESALAPGIALSWFRRRLPSTTLEYLPGNDTLSISDTRFTGEAWRLTINKRFGLFTIGGGVGEDRLEGRTDVRAVVNEELQGAPARGVFTLSPLVDRTTRRTGFVHAGVGTGALGLVAELGWSQGGTRPDLVNTFGDARPNGGYRYGSVGLRTRF